MRLLQLKTITVVCITVILRQNCLFVRPSELDFFFGGGRGEFCVCKTIPGGLVSYGIRGLTTMRYIRRFTYLLWGSNYYNVTNL